MKINEYNSKDLPSHLSNPYYFLERNEATIKDEDLEKDSDEEVFEKKSDQNELNILKKIKTKQTLDLLEVTLFSDVLTHL